jgi:hypothetical protein
MLNYVVQYSMLERARGHTLCASLVVDLFLNQKTAQRADILRVRCASLVVDRPCGAGMACGAVETNDCVFLLFL